MPTTPSEDEVISWFDSLSNWGRWGPDDELGTLNLVTPAKVAGAVATVSEGLAVSCSRVLDLDDKAIPGLYAAGSTVGGLDGGPHAGYVGGLIKATIGLRAAETIAGKS